MSPVVLLQARVAVLHILKCDPALLIVLHMVSDGSYYGGRVLISKSVVDGTTSFNHIVYILGSWRLMKFIVFLKTKHIFAS